MPERDDFLVPGPLARPAILGVVLAGGKSSRFGGNKALAPLGGVRLIDGVLARARAQTARVVISGKCQAAGAAAMVPDAWPGEGPLTGVLSALLWAGSQGYRGIVTFPCDAPFFPDDLVARLDAASGGEICSFACCQARRHPAFALWPLAALDEVALAYDAGERSLMEVHDRVGARAVEFLPGNGPRRDPFFNINRQEDLAVAESWLGQHATVF